MTIARLTVQRGDLTEYPLATRIKNGWQNGVTFYPDETVTKVTELRVIPLDSVEPDWEYGIRAAGDDEPYSDIYEDLDWLLDGALATVDDQIVRRRKAGAWERVPAPAPSEGSGK